MSEFHRTSPNWAFKLIAKRFLWTFIFEPTVRWLPKHFSVLRIILLRIFGAKIGSNCIVLRGVRVTMPWNLIVGDFVSIGESVNIYNFGIVKIDSETTISQYNYLCTGSHDYDDPGFPLIYGDISIGKFCWIASGCFVSPGVSISDGVVVGAKSLIIKDISEPWTVWAGHPARKIKKRLILKK
jgi:putative colanic acid biosynthesis acetyltransferase WcaF